MTCYVLTESQPILALLIYGKDEQGGHSPAQRKMAAALAAEMKQGAGSRPRPRTPISDAS